MASPGYVPPPPDTPTQKLQAVLAAKAAEKLKNRTGNGGDQLRNLKIESELRREIRENIAHQRMIGSYVGRRHAMHLPVRGQNTQTNAKTARKLNRVERYG